ncbi:hypothetical protein [Dickeya dianthicola]|uniref:hypothetical protein n=1 Tax=Dickeya dianthicola TaxID=204039 RepID=UPI001866EAB9|nr:hypothetical protein [Dickeya dianthicola]QOL14535.1 hypothetical protein HGI48_10165 [Dickeya dianthicola]
MNLKPLFLGVLLATTYATANAATTTVEKSATDATATSTAPVSAESALGKAVDKANTDAAINAERDVSAVKANVGGDNVAKTEKVAAETPMQGEEKPAKKMVKKHHADSTSTKRKTKASTGEKTDDTKSGNSDTQ